MDNSIESPSGDSKTYEMLWDCKFCGSKKLLGKTHRFCPNCGGQQDPSWRYFPADNEKVAVQDHVYVGADIICKACQALNGAKCEYCGNCGAALSDAAHAQAGASRMHDEGQAFVAEDLKQRQLADRAAHFAATQSGTASQKQGSKLKFIALGIIAVIGLIIFAFTRTQTTTVTTTDFKWERSVGIEVMQAISGKAECGHQPGDAYNISQHYEQIGTRQVPDGESCQTIQVNQGDGTFREQQQCHTKYRSEPVMGDMCRYVVNRWMGINPMVTSGNKATTPYWPSTGISQGSSCFALGCKRETQHNERYYLVLNADDGHPYECTVAHDVWDRSEIGSRFSIKIGSLLKTPKCDTLAAK